MATREQATLVALVVDHEGSTYGQLGQVGARTLCPLDEIADRARGHDPRPVTPGAAPTSRTARHDFPHDELDPLHHRRAILALAEQLGADLRHTSDAAGTLTLDVRYADRSRTRTLPEATYHSAALTQAAYRSYDHLGLQRARVRTISLRASAPQPPPTTSFSSTRATTQHAGSRRRPTPPGASDPTPSSQPLSPHHPEPPTSRPEHFESPHSRTHALPARHRARPLLCTPRPSPRHLSGLRLEVV